MVSIPLGVQDFKKLRGSDYYYVDKSALIDDVIGENRSEVFLFTRPRRFGKSLNISMLDAYLNMEYTGNTWFDDLEISRIRPNDPEKNSHPVIYLDMKNLGDGTYESFIREIGFRIKLLFSRYLYLRDSEKNETSFREMFNDIYLLKEGARLNNSLLLLTMMLSNYHGKKVIILIDEYDNAVNSADSETTDGSGETDRRKILNFLKVFLTDVLKGCEYTQMAVLTGVMKIGKESIFSGLNNLRVNSVLSATSNERFGFTPDEVRSLCADFGHPEKFEEAKEWYDGYRFGDAEIYNPWSLLSYVAEGFRPKAYWAGTSGNGIIDKLMDNLGGMVFEDFQKIAKGEEVLEALNDSVVYADIEHGSDPSYLFSVMVMSGYLRAVYDEDALYALSIPNKEMRDVFGSMFASRLNMGGRIQRLLKAIRSGDAEAFEASLGDFVKSFDPIMFSHEHVYEVLVMTLCLNNEGRYEVAGELHAGKGNLDIRMRSMRGDLPHVVMELKQTKDENADLEKLAESAIRQINDMDYVHMLKGTILLYGVAFCKTDVCVKGETIRQRAVSQQLYLRLRYTTHGQHTPRRPGFQEASRIRLLLR